MYPLIAKTAAAAGWEHSAIDAYDNYDEHFEIKQSLLEDTGGSPASRDRRA
jgi:hypothetical protein